MALYILKLTVPPNTPESEPIEQKLVVEGKLLEKIEYRFPMGCFEGVKVQVLYGNRRISPKGRYKWVDGENEKVVDPVEWPLPARKCTLTIRAYSECEFFDHTITLRFVVRPYITPTWADKLSWMFKGVLERLRLLTGV